MLSLPEGICYLVLPDDTLDIIQTPRPQPVTLPEERQRRFLKDPGNYKCNTVNPGGDLEKPQVLASLPLKNDAWGPDSLPFLV